MEYLTVTQAAEFAGVTRQAIYDAAERKELTISIKFGHPVVPKGVRLLRYKAQIEKRRRTNGRRTK